MYVDIQNTPGADGWPGFFIGIAVFAIVLIVAYFMKEQGDKVEEQQNDETRLAG